MDFDANLPIKTIDFGTFHVSCSAATRNIIQMLYAFLVQCYPAIWGEGDFETAWGIQWIGDHVASQIQFNKPVILEEFGVKTDQAATYTAWLNEVISSGLTGYLIWQVFIFILINRRY